MTTHCWKESGYADFADATFGNGGQNLYVSRAGILQRIFRFDINRDGYADLFFINSHDFNERPPALVCSDVFGARKTTELPTIGAYAAATGDLNGDGYDELVIGHQCNGVHNDLDAFIYFGGPEGFSEKHKLELYVPDCRAVAIGDFNGDGKPEIAFASAGKLRIFHQTARGFEPGTFVDLELEVMHMEAADLDGDGCADLYVRPRKQPPRVLWGGLDGIKLDRHTLVGSTEVREPDELPGLSDGGVAYAEGWRPKVVRIDGIPHLFREQDGKPHFFPIGKNRRTGKPLVLDCEHVVSAASGDVNGDGRSDLVLVVCRERSATASSWVYWGGAHGFDNAHRTALPTTSARDATVADLDGDSCDDIAICQGGTDVTLSTESLVFRGSKSGFRPEPVRIPTHDAVAVLTARTTASKTPQLIFINHITGRVRGDVSAYIYHGGPDGFSRERRTELPGWSAPDAQCCDFNDDGWPDVWISNCAENAPDLDPGSFLYWGGPQGFHPDRKTVFPTVHAHGSAVGDFRHSGHLDIAATGFYNSELLIFQGGAKGHDIENPQRIILDPNLKEYRPSRKFNWADCAKQTQHYNEPRFLFCADFNNDGWLDLFISQIMGPRCLILWGGPNGFSIERSTWLNAEGSVCAQAADLNGDGWLELIVGGGFAWSKKAQRDSYVYIYWGGPQGFREDRRQQLPAHQCNSLTVADFNNDGVLDIFATSYSNGRVRDLDSYIYWGRPGGVYSASDRTRLFCHSACGCYAADFNEDGWVDLAVANHKTEGNHVGESYVWWNGPEGFSEKRITKLPTMGPHGMLPVDPGNVMTRGPEEFYVSSAHELPRGASVTSIRWDAELQPKTWVKAQLRFAATKEALTDATWVGPDGADTWFDSGHAALSTQFSAPNRWIQYRLAIGAVNGGNSPRVKSVSVEYRIAS